MLSTNQSFFILLPVIRYIEVTPFILSGTILKSLFAGILTSGVVMQKSAWFRKNLNGWYPCSQTYVTGDSTRKVCSLIGDKN